MLGRLLRDLPRRRVLPAAGGVRSPTIVRGKSKTRLHGGKYDRDHVKGVGGLRAPPERAAKPGAVVQQVEELYLKLGHHSFNELLTVPMLSYSLQAGHLAEKEGAPQELVAAAFLHIVGQMLLHDGREDRDVRLQADSLHEHVGAAWLKSHGFPRVVTEPVRLQVEAKRYLCGTDRGYLQSLPVYLKATLDLQGGPMQAAEACEFLAMPYALGGVQLCFWGDMSSSDQDEANTPPLDHFLKIVQKVLEKHLQN